MSDDDIARMTYEQALAELDTLIARLEGGTVDLDEAVSCYERGSRLAQRCAELLDRTEARVMQLVVGPGGAFEERPFSPQADPLPQPSNPQRAAAGATPRSAQAAPRVPPPPTSPMRARAVPPPPDLFPGLEPQAAPGGDAPPPDLDDIPF